MYLKTNKKPRSKGSCKNMTRLYKEFLQLEHLGLLKWNNISINIYIYFLHIKVSNISKTERTEAKPAY